MLIKGSAASRSQNDDRRIDGTQSLSFLLVIETGASEMRDRARDGRAQNGEEGREAFEGMPTLHNIRFIWNHLFQLDFAVSVLGRGFGYRAWGHICVFPDDVHKQEVFLRWITSLGQGGVVIIAGGLRLEVTADWIPIRTWRAPRKYVFDVTSVGQR